MLGHKESVAAAEAEEEEKKKTGAPIDEIKKKKRMVLFCSLRPKSDSVESRRVHA